LIDNPTKSTSLYALLNDTDSN